MIKQCLSVCLLMFMSHALLADTAQAPAGFLWYNLPKAPQIQPKKKVEGTPFSQLSYTQRDEVLHFYTMEALHKARQTKSVDDMRVFLSLQHYWLQEASRFQKIFQQTMISYPEYDYTVTHPTSNVGTKLVDERRETTRGNVITSLSKTHGLLFFYRSQNAYDKKQIPILRDFCKRFGLSLQAISVDGATSPELPNSRLDEGHANALGVRFFPAILLVNPKNRQTAPVAFGLTTQDALEQHLFAVATQFKGEPA